DSREASAIANRLYLNGLEVYLDIADRTAQLGVDDLSEHIRKAMSSCTQLIAVISSNASESWWVPWEIGVATEKLYPIASYALDQTTVPDYLRKWPYLTQLGHIDDYCTEAKLLYGNVISKRATLTEASIRRTTADFYRSLKSRLGQR